MRDSSRKNNSSIEKLLCVPNNNQRSRVRGIRGIRERSRRTTIGRKLSSPFDYGLSRYCRTNSVGRFAICTNQTQREFRYSDFVDCVLLIKLVDLPIA
jgi:hypothetical protein